MWFWSGYAACLLLLFWALVGVRRKSGVLLGREYLTNALLFLEIVALRLRHVYARDVPFTASLVEVEDPKLGWRGKSLSSNTGSVEKRLLIVGDSFSHGLTFRNEELYASHLDRLEGFSTFLYAAPGYGSLQEYLAVRKYIDEIQPDLILVQLCSNDVLNNDYFLEQRSIDAIPSGFRRAAGRAFSFLSCVS